MSTLNAAAAWWAGFPMEYRTPGITLISLLLSCDFCHMAVLCTSSLFSLVASSFFTLCSHSLVKRFWHLSSLLGNATAFVTGLVLSALYVVLVLAFISGISPSHLLSSSFLPREFIFPPFQFFPCCSFAAFDLVAKRFERPVNPWRKKGGHWRIVLSSWYTRGFLVYVVVSFLSFSLHAFRFFFPCSSSSV